MKKRLLSLLLAIVMVLSVAPVTVLAVEDIPAGAVALVTNASGTRVEGNQWRVGENTTIYDTEAQAKEAADLLVEQYGDGKWYIGEDKTTPYDTKDEAKDHAVYQNGDGKYYLATDTEHTGDYYEDEAAVYVALVETGEGTWSVKGITDPESYGTEEAAQEAALGLVKQNGNGLWYTDAEYKTEGKAKKADAIDALSEGTVKQDGDGKWYFKDDTGKQTPYNTEAAAKAKAEELVNCIDYLGNGYFKTLAAAIKAVPADKAQYTVTMVDDDFIMVEESTPNHIAMTIKKDQNIVLDINGKQIFGCAYPETWTTPAGNFLIDVNNGASLTIKDSKDTGLNGKNCGMLSYGTDKGWVWSGEHGVYAGSYSSSLIRNAGTVTIESGYLYNDIESSAGYVIDGWGNYTAHTIINGGKLEARMSNAVRVVSGQSKLDVNGGVLASCGGAAVYLWCYGPYHVNISGGDFYACYNHVNGSYLATENAFAGWGYNKETEQGISYVTITGGHFYGGINLASDSPNSTLDISGDTIIEGNLYSESKVTISDGTFKGYVNVQSGNSDRSSITGGNFNGYVYTTYTSGDSAYYDPCLTGGTYNNVENFNTYTRYQKNGILYTKNTTERMRYYKDINFTFANLRAELYGPDYAGTSFTFGSNKYCKDHDTKNTHYNENWFVEAISNFGETYYVEYDNCTLTSPVFVLDSVTTYDADTEDWSTLAKFASQGYTEQKMLSIERLDDGTVYQKYLIYKPLDLAYPSEVATGYFARDNEDGTYDIVQGYAKIYFQSKYYWDSENKQYSLGDTVNLWGARNYTGIAKAFEDFTNYNTYYPNYPDLGNYGYLVQLTRDSNEKFTLPAGVTFVNPKGEDGNNLYAYTGTVSAPAGMAVVITEKDDGTYYTVRQEGQQTNIETKMVEQTTEGGETVLVKDQVNFGTTEAPDMKDVPAITISGKKDAEQEEDKTLAGDELKKAAVEAAEKITANKAVTDFKDVGINEALKNESEAKDKEQKVDVKVDAVVVTKETAMVQTLTTFATTDTTSYQQSFDVKPMVKAEAAPAEDAADKNQYKQDASGEWWKIIPNEDIEGEVTFRLPIESAIAKDTVAVYHKASASVEGKGEFLGFFPIKSETKDSKTFKFVELKASEFSVYTYEVMTSVSQNDAFAIDNGDGTYTGYETLGKLTTAIGDSTGKTAILLVDMDDGEDAELDFGHGEGQVKTPTQFTLDLNGHKLQGVSGNSNKVTITNSDLENYALLQATGVYANDVSALCSDGYATETPTGEGAVANSKVIKLTSGTYQVVVDVTTGTDRVEGNNEVDVFAGDTVTVTVSILGAKYAAADITLSYDKDNFTLKPLPRGSAWTRNDADGTVNFCKANPTTGTGYYQPGIMPSGTFTFTVKEGNEVILKDMFSVSEVDAYITPAWSDVGTTEAAEKLTENQLKDDWANIRLKQMSASVTPNNGLSYKEIGQKLLADGYTATNSLTGAVIDDATISYAILPRDVAEGKVQMTDEGGNKLFYDKDGYLVTEDTGTPAYKLAEAPAAEDYQTVQPTVTDAGDYTIFWKIDRAGYIGVSGKENVSIAPLNVTLNWTMPKDNKDAVATQGTQGEAGYIAGYTPIVIGLTNKGVDRDGNKTAENDNQGNLITADYWGSYSESGFGFNTTPVTSATIGTTKNIVASVVALNQTRIATVTMTGKPDVAEANVMKAVGTYEFTADLGSNYNISNPKVTVLIDGGKIVGYDLSATTEGASVYYDGKEHTATVMTPGEGATPDVTVKYCYSTDNGETFTEWGDNIPVLSNSNPFPYIVKMQLSKDSFYTQEKNFNFSIKPVQYHTEYKDYVVGWDIVLVYTDEDVPSFNYDGKMMYDVTSFKYMRDDDEHEYAHVYGFVVEGNAETSKVLPSNVELIKGDKTLDDGTKISSYKVLLNEKGKLDANMTNPAKVDIYDLTAVQGTYNVNRIYLTGEGATGELAKLTEQQRIAIVLRADVNNDKKVDTMDCSLIMKEMNK